MKKLAAVLAVLLLSTLLFAASYDEILSKSMANSPQMKNAEGRMCLREFKQKVAPDEELLRRLANLVGEDKVRYDRSK